ncbi:DNA repair protein RecO [Kaistia dalseonensis]|uniref:DNA repair protein RecO n=1 Tax=Kaistia dalseonensis TaxID=410840 RepID=A0ABU0H2G9_9HYPH|nr:DNA repair protein RecO [Kaistia dalseonensis]MCX5493134.1 DNA repair protein RecO [Kaistia dalseonensis]MDQ0435689.1 DNA repair protein RecO (recombination protein O) [Kaistia dalseonensis]
MEWIDQGIVLGTRRHGEVDVVLELMTASRGRHLGLVRGGRSRRLAPVLQPGNRLQAVWRARLDEHLGYYTVEPIALRAAQLFETPGLLYALQTLTGHLGLLAERESHPGLYGAVDLALDSFAGTSPPELFELCAFIARFELALLDELGLGLDLSQCARTGMRDDLAYVSPRSGRAVSRAGAVGYEDRLLPLAGFMVGRHGSNNGPAEIRDAFRLTGHFLQRDIYAARAISEPTARKELLALVDRLDRAE